jgi:hypothetical protein
MKYFLIFFFISMSAFAKGEGDLPATPTVPLKVIPAIPVIPVIQDTDRIVLWKEQIEVSTWEAHSQTVSGGDEACLRFTGDISIIRATQQSSICLKPDGTYLFSVDCDPPNPGIILKSLVIYPKQDVSCKRND